MKAEDREQFARMPVGNEAVTEAEQTLRMLARLAPPAGLEERVYASLRRHSRAPKPRRRFWLDWEPAVRLQFAGAAVVLAALAGGGVGLYRGNHTGADAARRGVAQPGASQPALPAVAGPGGPAAGSFGTAGSVGVPKSLTPIHVPPAPRKKQSAAHLAHRRSAPRPADAKQANELDTGAPAAPQQ